MTLSADEIRAAKDRIRVEKVSVPEWSNDGKGGHVYVRQLKASEAQVAKTILQSGENSEQTALVKMCLLCCCDKEGARMFDASHEADLLEGPLAPVQRCAMKALEVNGLLDEQVEGSVKNSESSQTSDSLSA